MIYNALHYVVQELNAFLKLRFAEHSSTKAVLGSILNEAGLVPEENQNKMILTLVNLGHPTTTKEAMVRTSMPPENLPFEFNFDLLATALFNDYGEALKLLSETIHFFQEKQMFNSENSPTLDPNIRKITFEIVNTNYEEVQSLWTALGANYMPSILYKVRMHTLQPNSFPSVRPIIDGLK